ERGDVHRSLVAARERPREAQERPDRPLASDPEIVSEPEGATEPTRFLDVVVGVLFDVHAGETDEPAEMPALVGHGEAVDERTHDRRLDGAILLEAPPLEIHRRRPEQHQTASDRHTGAR